VTTYIIRRLLLAVPVLLGALLFLFVAVRVLPGDIAVARLGDHANPEQVQQLRRELGLDKPIYRQFVDWIWGVARLDFGRSLWNQRSVNDNIKAALPITLELALLAMLIQLCIAVPFGVISAAMQDRWPDYILRLGSITALAVPSFWLATLVITFPAIWWNWALPPGTPSVFDQPANLIKFGIAAACVALSTSAIVLRLLRSMMLEVLRQDYMRTAYAKGLRQRTALIRHGLKNGLIPVITIVGNQMGFLLGGVVIIEQVFSLPGLGRLALDAINQRDYPQLEANVFLLALGYVLINLLVDVLYGFVDPRVRLA
jgi:peptide/nickel transport system permease protein